MMDAREYVERMAYQAIEQAAMERQNRRTNFQRSNTTNTAPRPPTEPAQGNILHKSSSCVDGGFGVHGHSLDGKNQKGDVHLRIHASKSTQHFQNGTNRGLHSANDLQNNPTVMGNVKKRLSDNFEHYSNIFHEVALPLLFRKGRARSRSRSSDGKRDQNSNAASAKERPIEEDYYFVEHIELHNMDGFVFSSRKELGQGHNFIPVHLKSASWCDKCGDFIWGVYKQCLKCTNCEYTCHHKCREGVALDCSGDTSEGTGVDPPCDEVQSEETSLSEDSSQADDADSGYHTANSTLQSRGQKGAKRPPGEWTLTREDLRRRIETFNNNSHGLIMSLQQDTNTFQGFIRVHMNLIRPINMSLSTRPTSIYDVIGQDEVVEQEGTDMQQITSFYLPKDTTKVIHIDSATTAQEVIKALLSKFKITDNPRKFALYEKSEPKGTMRRMEDDECPLPLCLCWTSENVEGLDRRRFILQENDTGEIMWEAFSLPELENFLKILNKEEEEYVDQVKYKYRMLKVHMQRRLKELDASDQKPQTDHKRNPVFV